IADLAEPPDEALDAVAAVTGHAVEFVGRSDPQGSFRLRLVEADDFDTVSDAANAVRMLDDVLWVSVIAEHRADTPSSVAPSGAGAPQAAGEPVSRILVMFRDPATRNARSRQDA